MKKKALSLALALVMCLGLTVPAMAAGEPGSTTIQDDGGFSYTLSKPVVGTRINEEGETVYQIPEGTIITPVLPQGSTKKIEDYGDGDVEIFYTLTNEEGRKLTGNPYDTDFYVSFWVFVEDPNFGFMKSGDLEGTTYEGNAIQPLPEGHYSLVRTLSWYYHGDPSNTTAGGGGVHGSTEGSSSDSSTFNFDIVPDSGSAQPEQPAVDVENIPASGTAVASTQSVEVDGKKVEFQMYALLDANGNGTNYVKLRDLAHVLNGTKAQFAVGYDSATGITVTSGQPYADNGSEMNTPFSGDRAYTGGGQSVQVNGKAVELTAINLLDDNGGGYNYFKLRDLGKALGFNVSWSADRGIFVETDKPYVG